MGKNYLKGEEMDLTDPKSKKKFLKIVKTRTAQMSSFQLNEFIKVIFCPNIPYFSDFLFTND